MKRIFLEDKISDNVTIGGKDAHHLAYSLRAKKGEQIIAVDPFGNTALLELVDFDKETIRAKCVGEITKVQSESNTVRITLAECLPKQNKFDAIVEKAAELGVNKIEPLISDRTIARPGTFRVKSKLERWARIAKEAAEQCGRDTLPKFGTIRELSDWLKEISKNVGHFNDKNKFDGKGALLIFCNETENNVPLQKVLRDYKNCDCTREIIILIGPEGGFTEKEIESIISAGGVSVTLGKTILKTDTAAISAIASVKYEFIF